MTAYLVDKGGICSPSELSFEGQLLNAQRQLDKMVLERDLNLKGGRSTWANEFFISVDNKKIAILKDLIAKHGGKPCKDGFIIGTVNDILEEKTAYSLPRSTKLL